MATFTQTDIEICYVDGDGVEHPLPYAFSSAQTKPTFRWTVPDGVKQSRFIFEMKSTTRNVEYTIPQEDESTRTVMMCAYMYSGVVSSGIPEYTVFKSITENESSNIAMPSYAGIGSWFGACEIRLTIYDSNGNQWCTHAKTIETYDFERTSDWSANPQYKKWYSRNDGLYFCVDPSLDTTRNNSRAMISFQQAVPEQETEEFADSEFYTLQIADTPLFNEGLHCDEFHEITLDGSSESVVSTDRIYIDDITHENGIDLQPNKIYYMRVRSDDGFDYSEWCIVNAFTIIHNFQPTCEIVSISIPYEYDAGNGTHILDENGNYVLPVYGRGDYYPAERPNGEMVVRFIIHDDDNDHVKAWLAFTMPVSGTRLNTLNDKDDYFSDLIPNENNTAPIEYNQDNSGKFIRAITNESLVHVPTNTVLEVTWCSAIGRMGDLTCLSTAFTAYMYLFATDGIDAVVSAPYEVLMDNSGIRSSEQGNVSNTPLQIRGRCGRNLKFPVLPDTVQRALIVHTIDSDDNHGTDMPGMERKLDGAVGTTDSAVSYSGVINGISVNASFTDLFTMHKAIEDSLGLEYLQRMTQKKGFIIYHHMKYNKECLQYGEFTQDSLDAHYLHGDTFIRGIGEKTEYATDEEEKQHLIEIGAYDTIDSDGYASFCPYCDELHMLKTKVLVHEKDGDHVYNSVQEAFWDNTRLEQTFDGTPYELIFECENCHHAFPLDFRYQQNLSTSVRGINMKPNFSYWHGYNSGERTWENTMLQKALLLTRKTDYDAFVEEWKAEYKKKHNKEAKDDDCPVKWIEIKRKKSNGEEAPLIDYKELTGRGTGGDIDAGGNTGQTYNVERFGIMPDDALLKLDPRPEFDAYDLVHSPRTMNLNEHVYIDGAKLNADIDDDYMHDYKKVPPSQNEMTQENESGQPGDASLCRLASQFPWWIQPRVGFDFFEGAVSLAPKNEKKGYMGVDGDQTGGSSSDGEEGTIVMPGTINEIQGTIVEYRMLGDAGTKQVDVEGVKTEQRTFADGTRVTAVFNRMSCCGNARFPITIQRGLNDRYKCIVNDEMLLEGSVLSDGDDTMVIDFPYTMEQYDPSQYMYGIEDMNSNDGLDHYRCKVDQTRANEFKAFLARIFSPAFSFDYDSSTDSTARNPFLKDFSFTMSGGALATIVNSKDGRNVDVIAKSIAFTLYGNTSLSADGVTGGRYRKFELLPCEQNCYDTLGIVPYVTYQSARLIRGGVNDSGGGLLLRTTTRPTSPFINGDEIESESERDAGDYSDQPEHYLYYTQRMTTKHKFHAQESPIDNCIDEFIEYSESDKDFFELSDELRQLRLLHRKPATKETTGEPLFTCYKDEVDSRGYHFRFTEEDYKKTGRIYIRRYHVETCNPFPMDGFGYDGQAGYRNWIVVPIAGKPGRYVKKQVLNSRGVQAEPREILVEIEEDEEPITEVGWFEPNGLEPFSHERKQEESSSQDGGQEDDDEPVVYKRSDDYSWRDNLKTKTCVVFDYVDISEAICKNPSTPDGMSPFSHICPINFNVGIYNDLFVNRSGWYVLGGYDLTDQQKALAETVMSPSYFDDEMPYHQTFTYVDSSTSEVQEITETMPSNYKPQIMNAKFDIIQGEASSVECIDPSKKGNSDDRWYATRTVNSFERYKKAWLARQNDVLDSFEPAREPSQWTVEQFNPAFRYSFGIYEKYGYQPRNTFQQYWKKDDDAIYSGKYIPLSSRIVHGLYCNPVDGLEGDPYADCRLIGTIMLERHIISDKTFRRVDESYDKKPFLDYRLIGKISNDILPYFSGYPRDEHPAYATRPEPPYPYDRQWRIGGWAQLHAYDGLKTITMKDRDALADVRDDDIANATRKALTNGYWTEPKTDMEVMAGAFIDELSYTGTHSFLYLQDTWNTFNRVHWSADFGKDDLLCLKAYSEYGNMASAFSVRTVNSEWSEELQAWYMRNDKSRSAMIDMTQSQFEQGVGYYFILQAYSYDATQDSYVISGTSITSHIFQIGDRELSPATIVSTEYDPWTKLLTITFRFDDALGRDYDIVGFQYLPNDSVKRVENGQTYIEWKTEDDFITPGTDNGTSVLIGELYDLKSNVLSRGDIPDDLLITHTVKVNVSNLQSISSSSNFRVKLISELSMYRQGLTLPVFTVKMWANEFLKPVEEQIMSLQGYKSNWKWVEKYDSETGTVSGSWEYLDDKDAPVVIGHIQETQESINDINNTFEKWFGSLERFCAESCTKTIVQNNEESTVKSGDIDSFEAWLKDSGEWDSFYYGYFFTTYLLCHAEQEYYEDYSEYRTSASSANDSLKPTTIIRRWLQSRFYDNDYKAWYQARRLSLLSSYRSEIGDSSLNSWIKDAMSLADAHVAYAHSREDDYKKYAGIEEPEEESSSSSSSSSIEITAQEALEYIEESGLQDDFMAYYALKCKYADTRFLERALIMDKVFGVPTAGVWEKTFTGTHAGEYAAWLAQGNNSSLSLSDRYQTFLVYASKSETIIEIIDEQDIQAQQPLPVPVESEYSNSDALIDKSEVEISNIGRSIAFNDFLQFASPNGFTYKKLLQALNNTLEQEVRLFYRCLNEKNMLETDFRRKLVGQGYFCNGFLDNTPYTSKDITVSNTTAVQTVFDPDAINTCFRWRVETRQYEGKMDSADFNSVAQGQSFGNFDERYNMYYRFQMDFFSTFDSQEGKPVIDKLFKSDVHTDENRILAGIDDASNSAWTVPGEADKDDRYEYVPSTPDDGAKESPVKSENKVKDLRFTSTFGLMQSELPTTDNTELPEEWNGAWDDTWLPECSGCGEKNKDWLATHPVRCPDCDETISYHSPSIQNVNYKNTYYWRVAPYNLVERPLHDAMVGGASYSNNYAYIDVMFHSPEITACLPWNSNGPSSSGLIQMTVYYSTGKRWNNASPSQLTNQYMEKCPIWQKNTLSAPFSSNSSQIAYSQYYGNPWLNNALEARGEVQFPTDRPRKVEYDEVTETHVIPPSIGGYTVMFQSSSVNFVNGNYNKQDQSLFPEVPGNVYATSSLTYRMYKTHFYGETDNYWFIGIQVNPYNHRNNLAIYPYTLYTSTDIESITDATSVTWTYAYDNNPNTNQYTATITPIMSSGSSYDETIMIPRMSYIEDNIGNYDTQWIPNGVERMKPCVIRLLNQYLMFTHKRMSRKYDSQGSLVCDMNVITMSRGMSSDVFGEEGMCLPRYTFESIGDYVYETDANGAKTGAVSLENPSVVQLPGGAWRMYFNAVFYHEGAEHPLVTRMFKADTTDFDQWTGIAEIMESSTTPLDGFTEPNVVYMPEFSKFWMFAVSLTRNQQATTEFKTIHRLSSTDGVAFTYDGEIERTVNDEYEWNSPSFIRTDTTRAKLYFTLKSAVSALTGRSASCICSIEGTIALQNTTENNVTISAGTITWDTYYHNGNRLYDSMLMFEKANAPYQDINVFPVGSSTRHSRFFTEGINFSNGDDYFNPCVLLDCFNGCEVYRMYYNTHAHPYVWHQTELTEVTSDEPQYKMEYKMEEGGGLGEVVINTEYLEEDKWSSISQTSGYINCRYSNNGEWTSLPYEEIPGSLIGGGGRFTYLPASTDGSVKLRVPMSYANPSNGRIMVALIGTGTRIRCMAQAKWIGYENVANTDALLLPETNNEIDYSLDKYSPYRYIVENELLDGYNEWRNATYPTVPADRDINEIALDWILGTSRYPEYAWWSRKGPGIYRYVGHDILKNYDWADS